MAASNDNRELCGLIVPSSCIPFTGYVSAAIKPTLPCRPNINDVVEQLQILIDKINTELGRNSTLDKKCLTFTPATVKQVELNQLFITELCAIKTTLAGLSLDIDPDLIMLAVNLLCLQDPACTPQATYTLTEVITKLITAYCNLLTRVTAIETLLNI